MAVSGDQYGGNFHNEESAEISIKISTDAPLHKVSPNFDCDSLTISLNATWTVASFFYLIYWNYSYVCVNCCVVCLFVR